MAFSCLWILAETPCFPNELPLSDGWRFHQGDLGGPWEALRESVKGDALEWRDVSVPHCYNAMDAVDPDVAYYQGPAWYQRDLRYQKRRTSDRVLIRFGGMGQRGQVFVGEDLVAEHVCGYSAAVVDITDAVAKYGDLSGEAPLVVRCDNSRDLELPPSDLSDFTLYGGLYREVRQAVVPSVSVQRVDVTPTVVAKRGAGAISVVAHLRNHASSTDEVQLTLTVSDPTGKVVHQESKNEPATVMGHPVDASEWDVELKTISLWSPEKPSLYSYTVATEHDGQSHATSGRFGFRECRFEERGPFYLNGERLLLRGTHRHEDHAAFGAAVPSKVVREELQMIKRMGANFIRLGHYPQTDLVLDLCDELGLLVWEEIPWCRGGVGGEKYQLMTRRMLREMVDQHRNHPSVIMWGLGNENDWPGDQPGFDKDAVRGFMMELHALAKRLDPTRVTSIRRCDFCKDVVDVYSPSIWAGWYRGRYTDYYSVSEREMQAVQHFFHAEWGASQHAGRHSEDPDVGIEAIASGDADERLGDFLMSGGSARVSKDGDWSETYACNLIDWHLMEQERMPWLTGSAYWVFKDFATPLRPENPVPYVNQKGVVQRDLTPKESYYVFQSYWAEEPMLRIYGRTWPRRWGDKGEPKMVKVYSNCDRVELFLNGESLGGKERNSTDFPAAGLRWRTAFREGVNRLRAVADQGGERLIDEISFVYDSSRWGSVSKLAFAAIDESADKITVQVSAVDGRGRLCLDAKNRVRFSVAGDAQLIDNQGTARGSRVVQLANGVARITARRGRASSVLGVSSEGLESQFVTAGAMGEHGSEGLAEQRVDRGEALVK